MAPLQQRITELIGKSRKFTIKGCMEFGEDCGKRREDGSYLCKSCNIHRQQWHQVDKYQKATLSDLHRWLNANSYIWEQRDCDIKIFDPVNVLIDYDSMDDLLDQSESTLEAIIKLIERYGIQGN